MARYELQGKIALVTGAARGIGFETARALTERGATAVILDLDEDASRAAASVIGPQATGMAADVTDRDAMEAAVAEVVERFGGLDIVVANAGVAPPTATMRSIDPDVFERTIEIDLLGVWRTVRPALPEITARRGHVVVVSSVYAWVNGMLNSPYAMAKAGVEAMGRALRTELAIHGASATVAHFGFIDTRMVQDAFEDEVVQSGIASRTPRIMMRRLQPPDGGRRDRRRHRAARAARDPPALVAGVVRRPRRPQSHPRPPDAARRGDARDAADGRLRGALSPSRRTRPHRRARLRRRTRRSPSRRRRGHRD